ncbi:MAG: hypothetical protein LBM04_01275 [Opitutaceae bacterium]|nr:hypothetical protein [Opitutaceae bacterium]
MSLPAPMPATARENGRRRSIIPCFSAKRLLASVVTVFAFLFSAMFAAPALSASWPWDYYGDYYEWNYEPIVIDLFPPYYIEDDDYAIVGIAYPENIIYRINGTRAWGGEYYFSPGDTVTITAEPESGYCFPDGSVTAWTHTFGSDSFSPNPPDFWDEPGYSIVCISESPHFIYWLNGEQVWSGEYSFSPGDTVTVTVEPEEGFSIPDGVTSEWTHTFAAWAVTPEPPVFIGSDDWGPCVYIPGFYNDFNITYRINGEAIWYEENYFSEGDTVTVTAEIPEGYSLSEGAVAEWTHTFGAGSSPQPVTPDEPDFTEAQYYGDDTVVVIPLTENVLYRINGTDVCEGEYYYSAGDTVTVTAVLDGTGDYCFSEGAATEWTHTFAVVKFTPSGTWSPGGLLQYGVLTASAHLNAVFVNPHNGEAVTDAVSYNKVESGAPGQALTPGMMLPSGTYGIRATLPASVWHHGAQVDATLTVATVSGIVITGGDGELEAELYTPVR